MITNFESLDELIFRLHMIDKITSACGDMAIATFKSKKLGQHLGAMLEMLAVVECLGLRQ